MKIRNCFVAAAMGIMLLGSITACGSKEEATTEAATQANTQAATEEATEAASPSRDDSSTVDEFFITFQGVDISTGMTFADIKDKLGNEVKPSETIEPCDGGDFIQIMHFYDGLTVTTLRDEIVHSLELQEAGANDALIQGKLKIGDQVEEVKRILGKPENEDEYAVSYTIGTANVMIYLTDGKISGFMVMNYQ